MSWKRHSIPCSDMFCSKPLDRWRTMTSLKFIDVSPHWRNLKQTMSQFDCTSDLRGHDELSQLRSLPWWGKLRIQTSGDTRMLFSWKGFFWGWMDGWMNGWCHFPSFHYNPLSNSNLLTWLGQDSNNPKLPKWPFVESMIQAIAGNVSDPSCWVSWL